MRKKLSKYLASFLVALSIISIGQTTKAAQIDTVLCSWERVSQRTNVGIVTYNENHQYKNITFTNGYSYKETTKDIKTFWEGLFGTVYRILHTRHYTTY